MKISELAHKPKLINIVVDDQEVQELYNDAIEFWCYDRQPLNKFVKFANMSEDTYPELIDVKGIVPAGSLIGGSPSDFKNVGD